MVIIPEKENDNCSKEFARQTLQNAKSYTNLPLAVVGRTCFSDRPSVSVKLLDQSQLHAVGENEQKILLEENSKLSHNQTALIAAFVSS